MAMTTCFRTPTLAGTQKVTTPPRLPLRTSKRQLNLVTRMSKSDEPKENSSGQDSYSKIEAPVRDTIPDGGIPVSDRNWGQDELNPQLKSDKWNPDRQAFGTTGIVDSFRFAGAIPEVANSRLAMLGFVLAVIGEATTGRNVFQQVELAPAKVALVFLTFVIATAVPVLRGVPRKGNAIFSSDAELVNGRVAMIGFTGLLLTTFYTGSYLSTLVSWLPWTL